MEAVENHVRIERVYDDPLGATGGFRVFADRWPEFKRRYEAELESNPDMQQLLDALKQHSDVVLLTAVRDVAHSHVPVIAAYLEATSSK